MEPVPESENSNKSRTISPFHWDVPGADPPSNLCPEHTKDRGQEDDPSKVDEF
jgi:hypothetical protein